MDWFAETDDPVSPPGIRDYGLLASAVGRPFQSMNFVDVYPTIFDKAAALFHSIINNHPFFNGNKRCALVSAQVVLDQSKLWLEKCSDEEMFEFTRKTAAHEICEHRPQEVETISQWLSTNSRKVTRGEHPLKFHSLKLALSRFGFEIEDPTSNILDVTKNGIVVATINKQGMDGFRPYHTDYISGLRKRLGLMPEDGVDSSMFYGVKGVQDVASEFIEIRQEVVRRLAQT